MGGSSGVCGAAPAGSGYWEKVGGSPELGGGGWGLCCGAVSSPSPVHPLLPQFPKQREQAILPRMLCLPLDDSSPPPELHLQALIDACRAAQLPPAQPGSVPPSRTPEGWLVLSGALGPGDMSFLAPWQRGQSQHDLTKCSRARMLRGLPFFWGDAAVPAPSPCPSLLQNSPTLCSVSPFGTGRPLGWCTSWPAQGSEHFLVLSPQEPSEECARKSTTSLRMQTTSRTRPSISSVSLLPCATSPGPPHPAGHPNLSPGVTQQEAEGSGPPRLPVQHQGPSGVPQHGHATLSATCPWHTGLPLAVPMASPAAAAQPGSLSAPHGGLGPCRSEVQHPRDTSSCPARAGVPVPQAPARLDVLGQHREHGPCALPWHRGQRGRFPGKSGSSCPRGQQSFGAEPQAFTQNPRMAQVGRDLKAQPNALFYMDQLPK